MEKITLLFIDDHRLLLDTWTDLFNTDKRFEVIGSATSGHETYDLLSIQKPNIALCDICMQGTDGFEITKMIRLQAPSTKVIGLSMYNMIAYAKKMMDAGASGYVTKNSSIEDLKEAIILVHQGRKYICQEILQMRKGKGVLTKKELDIILAIKEGFSSREIATKFDIALKTVEVHRYNILHKLKLPNSAALVNYANRLGI